jgi:hypothetical protein
MNKLNASILALLFAILGGCATSPGDLVGTGALDNIAAVGSFPSHGCCIDD